MGNKSICVAEKRSPCIVAYGREFLYYIFMDYFLIFDFNLVKKIMLRFQVRTAWFTYVDSTDRGEEDEAEAISTRLFWGAWLSLHPSEQPLWDGER